MPLEKEQISPPVLTAAGALLYFQGRGRYVKTPCLLRSAEPAQTRAIISELLVRLCLRPSAWPGLLELGQIFAEALCSYLHFAFEEAEA